MVHLFLVYEMWQMKSEYIFAANIFVEYVYLYYEDADGLFKPTLYVFKGVLIVLYGIF